MGREVLKITNEEIKKVMLDTIHRHYDYNLRQHADDLARRGFDLFKKRRPEVKIEKFVKKPIPVEMVQVTKENIEDVVKWCGGSLGFCEPHTPEGMSKVLGIKTREGEVQAYEGDFIAKGIEGEFYPIGKEIHEKTYMTEEDGMEMVAQWES